MPPKAKPKGKKAEPPPSDNRKRQASDAAEKPVKWPRRGTNQKGPEPDNADEVEEEEEEGDEDEDEGDPAPWAEVEEKAISKGKVKGPVRGRGGNQGQGKQAQAKKPRYIFLFLFSSTYSTLAVEKLPRPATEKMRPCKAHQRLNKQRKFFFSFV